MKYFLDAKSYIDMCFNLSFIRNKVVFKTWMVEEIDQRRYLYKVKILKQSSLQQKKKL